MVGDVQAFVRNSIPAGYATYEPSRLIFKWLRRARHHWRHTVPAEERVGGCSLLFIVATPSRVLNPTFGYFVHAPAFEPEPIPGRTARSIGSGAHVEEYAAELERLGEEWLDLLQFDFKPFPGGPLIPIALALSEVIEKHSRPGVSPHLHLCSVRFGEVVIATNDIEGLSPGAPSRTMPAVAETYEEWCALKDRLRLAQLVAVA